MKKTIALVTAMLSLLSACSSATLDTAGKELEDAITNVSDADNKYVLMVKGGYRADDPSTTYEDAFSAFFGTPRWKYFEGEDGQDVVEFTGDCTYQDVPVKARIQFVVDEENGTFEATYLAFNEVPQNALTLAAVISKAFEEATAASNTTTVGTGEISSSEDETPNTTAQVLLYDIPVQPLFEMSESEVIQNLGEPEVELGSYIEYRVDAPQWLDIWFDSEGKVDSVAGDAANLTYQGQNLYQDQDVIVALLGNDYENLGGTGYAFQCQWVMDGYCFVFSFPMVADDAGRFMAQSVEVYKYGT